MKLSAKTSIRFLSMLAALFTATANAASISLSPQTTQAAPGDSLSFDLLIDFSGDPTFGGAIDFFFDNSLLSFQGFTTATTTLVLDPAYDRSPDPVSSGLEGLAFGSDSGLEAGIVGTLTFQALAAGDTALTMAVTTDPLKGGDFYSAVTYQQQAVTFLGSQVEVSAVPVPAAVWLFGSGLIGLAGIARRRSA
ncbi:ornithine/acetylornithine aminotransferase [Thiohalobacter thiocyanaticus]|uniref:Ornithine/acetylornithine aminotransferase n=1 Tax=Thiohalobacter thiocyanaticus TaxID=585455 RepID=A0A1Z4VRQ4_9GAMM|nr:VPLPA-CTERM sorting domain-containing protein [Thiohalobacter thiocyanaticus]BAZ94310.1 ornithine/acetylornithine aminotransferase [Thiohalobacter thiocyanaticus]